MYSFPHFDKLLFISRITAGTKEMNVTIVNGIFGCLLMLFGLALLGICMWLAPTIRWVGEGGCALFGAVIFIWMGQGLVREAIQITRAKQSS